MSLIPPSQTEKNKLFSSEAQENLAMLRRVDQRGSSEQIATKVAIDCLNQIHQLQPRYLDGVRSWLKASCVYVLGGAAGAGVVVGATYAAYSAAIQDNVALIIGALGVHAIAIEAGVKPLRSLTALYWIFVRDAAYRAAKWSATQDQRTRDARAAEAKECHQEICKQLRNVYDDCANKIRQDVHIRNVGESIEFWHKVDALACKLPTIEEKLKEFQLSPNEISCILNNFKEAMRFAQMKTCELCLERGSEERNLQILVNCKDLVKELAVPRTIRDQIFSAQRSRIGYLKSLQGYGSSVVSGVKVFGYTAAALAAVLGSGYIYMAFNDSEISKNSNVTWSQAAKGVSSIASCVALFSIARGWANHSQNVSNHSAYVREEIERIRNELKHLYDGIADVVASLPEKEKQQVCGEIEKKLPTIEKEIERLGIPDFQSVIQKLKKQLPQK